MSVRIGAGAQLRRDSGTATARMSVIATRPPTESSAAGVSPTSPARKGSLGDCAGSAGDRHAELAGDRTTCGDHGAAGITASDGCVLRRLYGVRAADGGTGHRQLVLRRPAAESRP